MNHKKAFALIGLVVFAFIIAGVSYRAGTKRISPAPPALPVSPVIPSDWLEYKNDLLGVSFHYPVRYGKFVNFSILQGETGFSFHGNFPGGFPEKSSFAWGGLSDDYTAGRDADVYAFSRNTDYELLKQRYGAQAFTTNSGAEGYLFFGNPADDDYIGGFGSGGLGAVFELKPGMFDSIIFTASKQDVSAEEFEAIMKTVTITR